VVLRAHCDTIEQLGLLRGVDTQVDEFFSTQLDMTDEGQVWLIQPGLFWQAAKEDAQEQGLETKTYIQQIEENFDRFFDSGLVYDRDLLSEALHKVFVGKGKFVLLLGGKSVGKSLILQNMTEFYKREGRMVLYVDARNINSLQDGLSFQLAELKSDNIFGNQATPKNWKNAVLAFGAATTKETMENALNRYLPGWNLSPDFKTAISEIFMNTTAISEGNKVPESIVAEFISYVKEQGKYPVLIIDEANEFLGTGKNDTEKLLKRFVSATKQDRKLNVVLATSEHAYPYQLEQAHLNLMDLSRVIVAGELSPKDSWRLLVNATYPPGIVKGEEGSTIIGMGSRLARLCLAAHGGHVLQIKNAVELLSIKRSRVEVLGTMQGASAAIKECLRAPGGRHLLHGMAEKGFVAVDTPDLQIVEMIAKVNVGGVVSRERSVVVGLDESLWQETTCDYGLLPSTQSMRLAIARQLAVNKAEDEAGKPNQFPESKPKEIVIEDKRWWRHLVFWRRKKFTAPS
jgi:energy-coupling factor transporter ATP-binding protein EcfA2